MLFDVLTNPVVECFPWALFAEDAERRIVAVNRLFCSFFLVDVDPDALVGCDSRALWDGPLVRPEAECLTHSVEDRVREREAVRGELIRLADGRVLERDYVPLRGADGAAIGHLWLFTDVTVERRTEEYQNTVRKMEAVGRLAGGIAHDLNNALTAILGHASLLGLELGDRADLADSVNEIQSASERAASLSRNLLAFSRKQVLQPRRVDPAEVLRRVEGLLGRILNADIALVVGLPPRAGAVRVDAVKLENALLHLAMNARDAMPAGGSLSLSLEYREVGAVEAPSYPFPIAPGRYAILSVADTGSGISDEIRGKVFEPFFSTKPRHQGTGLGLSTVYGFVKQSDGFVWVESVAGSGAVIHVALPLLGDGEAPDVDADPRMPSVRRGERRARILVAEDEPSVLSVIRRGLEERGYDVITAGDGVEALEVLERDPHQIDLLITDVIMPRMGGAQLAQRAHEIAPQMPVIFTSGYSGDVLKYLEDAPLQFQLLEKPFLSADVVRLVEETLAE
jgi:signal transduction histidine kinase/CheY-like chemotaxis protein